MNETPKLSEIAPKDRPGYIWDYYKLPICGGICLLIAVIYTIVHIALSPEHYAYVAAINAHMEDGYHTDHILDDYAAKRGLKPKREIVYIDNTLCYDAALMTEGQSLYDRMAIDALISAQTFDLLISTRATFDMEARLGVLLPVSEYLTKEQMEKYADRIEWVSCEKDEIEQIACEGEAKEFGTKYARGIHIKNNPILVEKGELYAKDADIVVGIVANTKKPEIAKDLLLYLLGEVE